ncbi:MAG: hypothetical protein LBM07_04630, partial [Culturomica sp.]|nr:hypothetical protein [Culturomica sp.]
RKRNLYCIVLFAIFANVVFGQSTIRYKPELKDSLAQDVSRVPVYTENLDFYAGTWEYKNGDEVFRIFLKKVPEEIHFIKTHYGEILIGDYYYKKGGVVLDQYNEEDIPNIKNRQVVASPPIDASNGSIYKQYVDPLRLRIHIYDKRFNGKGSEGFITYISDAQIRLEVGEGEGVVILEEGEEDIEGFSFPTDVVLTRKLER